MLNEYKPVEGGAVFGKVVAVVVLAAVAMGLIVVTVWGYRTWSEYSQARTEEAALTQRASVDKKSLEGTLDSYIFPEEELTDNLDGRLYISGKVVVVDRTGRLIDSAFLELPDELRASRPEEVGTVVWLDWGKQYRWRYSNGAAAYTHAVRVSVIDLIDKKLIDSRFLYGSLPPENVRDKGKWEYFGTKPVRQIVAHLTNVSEGRLGPLPAETLGRETAMTSSDARFLVRMGGYGVIIFLSGLAGWWATVKMRRRLSHQLGRGLHGDHELTSIATWMEAAGKENKGR